MQPRRSPLKAPPRAPAHSDAKEPAPPPDWDSLPNAVWLTLVPLLPQLDSAAVRRASRAWCEGLTHSTQHLALRVVLDPAAGEFQECCAHLAQLRQRWPSVRSLSLRLRPYIVAKPGDIQQQQDLVHETSEEAYARLLDPQSLGGITCLELAMEGAWAHGEEEALHNLTGLRELRVFHTAAVQSVDTVASMVHESVSTLQCVLPRLLRISRHTTCGRGGNSDEVVVGAQRLQPSGVWLYTHSAFDMSAPAPDNTDPLFNGPLGQYPPPDAGGAEAVALPGISSLHLTLLTAEFAGARPRLAKPQFGQWLARSGVTRLQLQLNNASAQGWQPLHTAEGCTLPIGLTPLLPQVQELMIQKDATKKLVALLGIHSLPSDCFMVLRRLALFGALPILPPAAAHGAADDDAQGAAATVALPLQLLPLQGLSRLEELVISPLCSSQLATRRTHGWGLDLEQLPTSLRSLKLHAPKLFNVPPAGPAPPPPGASWQQRQQYQRALRALRDADGACRSWKWAGGQPVLPRLQALVLLHEHSICVPSAFGGCPLRTLGLLEGALNRREYHGFGRGACCRDLASLVAALPDLEVLHVRVNGALTPGHAFALSELPSLRELHLQVDLEGAPSSAGADPCQETYHSLQLLATTLAHSGLLTSLHLGLQLTGLAAADLPRLRALGALRSLRQLHLLLHHVGEWSGWRDALGVPHAGSGSAGGSAVGLTAARSPAAADPVAAAPAAAAAAPIGPEALPNPWTAASAADALAQSLSAAEQQAAEARAMRMQGHEGKSKLRALASTALAALLMRALPRGCRVDVNLHVQQEEGLLEHMDGVDLFTAWECV